MSGMKVPHLSFGLSACYQVSLQLFSPTCFPASARPLPHTHTHTKAADESEMSIKRKIGKTGKLRDGEIEERMIINRWVMYHNFFHKTWYLKDGLNAVHQLDQNNI